MAIPDCDLTVSELRVLQEDAENYHRVMGWLQDMSQPHGLCSPRSRLACTHCNAKDGLAQLRQGYRGPRFFVQESN